VDGVPGDVSRPKEIIFQWAHQGDQHTASPLWFGQGHVRIFHLYRDLDVIIGDLFFRDDKQLENIDTNDGEQNPADAVCKKLIKKQNEKKNAMKLFYKDNDALVYMVTIKDILRFNLAMDYVGIGLSFQQTVAAI